MDRERLAKMAASVRTGGKGTVRRKKKAVHKAATTDDKRLQGTLKRLGVNTIPGIEEVNLFQGTEVIHFINPKVQASIAANTYVVSGPSHTKNLAELVPGILNQMGPDNLQSLQRLAQSFPGEYNSGGRAPRAEDIDEDSDDDVPELVETFEQTAAK